MPHKSYKKDFISKLSRQAVIKVLEAIDEGKIEIPPKRGAKKHCLVHKGRRYPPKFVVSQACLIQFGQELPSNVFSGGRETNNILIRLGFDITSKELPTPESPTEKQHKVEDEISRTLDDARKLLNMKMHSQAIQGCGKVIEQLLRQIYREYLPSLPHSDKEKAISFEKKVGKSVNKFTLGQLIGLFREAQLFNAVFQDKKKRGQDKFIFFTPALMDTINTLRNIFTHPESGAEYYGTKEVASFVESAVSCILQELDMLSKQ